MASLLQYSERIIPLNEKRYFFDSIVNWCKTNAQRNAISAHRRLSEVQVQGMALVLQKLLTKNTVSGNADVSAALVCLAQTCKLAALTVDYIIQGKLTDFTGQPTKITEVARLIKTRSSLYANADYDAVWMLIAPPDSRTGDWTSFVPPNAAENAAKTATIPALLMNDVITNAKDPMLIPGSLIRYYAYQSLIDNPAQFFRLVSDTELVTTTAAMSERRRGLLRVAAAAHALDNLPNLIKLRLVETSFQRLSEIVGPIPLSRYQEQTLEDTMRYINRVDVLPSKAIALKIQAWMDDSTEPNMVGLFMEPVRDLTLAMISGADFAMNDIKNGDPTGATTDQSLVAFYDRVKAYVDKEYKLLAQRNPGLTDTPEFLAGTLVSPNNSFSIGPEQRFLMTGLPILALTPRFDVAAIMKLADLYVVTMTTLLKSFSGHHESYITTQDASEIPKLINFDAYLATDSNPWRNKIDRQNSANVSQTSTGLPVFANDHSTASSATTNDWCDYINNPALTRDLDEMELPLVVDSTVVRQAYTSSKIKRGSFGYWDSELRSKIEELVPVAGHSLLPVQLFPSGAGIKAIRLTDPAHMPKGQTTAFENTKSEVVDNVRDYVTRATGLSGKYLAIALQVPGTAKRLATLISSFATVFTLKDGTKVPTTFDPNDYEQVIGDGVPYGLVPKTATPDKDVTSAESYPLLAKLCHLQYIPIVQRLVYIRILAKTPNALSPVSVTSSTVAALNTASCPFYSTTLSIGRRFVGVKRDQTETTPVEYFVEAPALINLALIPPLQRFGVPPSIVLSRTHAYTLRTTAVLGETSVQQTAPLTALVDRYTTWSGVALDRLALHGETTKIITGASESTAVEQAMAEAAQLTAAAEIQIKDSVKVASTPVETAKTIESTVKNTAAKGVKASSPSDLPLA